jgi:hypothetical protein
MSHLRDRERRQNGLSIQPVNFRKEETTKLDSRLSVFDAEAADASKVSLFTAVSTRYEPECENKAI